MCNNKTYKPSPDINFVYAIFLTPEGKGYGCFAVKKIEDSNNRLVGASFCHPSDRVNFSKKTARNMAFGRALKGKEPFVLFVCEEDVDAINVVKTVISKQIIQMPSWAVKASKIGAFTFGLSTDNNSSSSLLKLFCKKNVDVVKGFMDWAV